MLGHGTTKCQRKLVLMRLKPYLTCRENSPIRQSCPTSGNISGAISASYVALIPPKVRQVFFRWDRKILNLPFLGICEGCRMTPQETVSGLLSRLRIAEERLKTGYQICASCTESVPSEPIKCESLDCSWFFERKKAEVKAENTILIHTLLDGMEVGE